ncbi:copper resistance CopC family protein [Kiloniella sp. EL199]|uniref:copper resistance CopC family protein n=1 Tax=Kiloniella sp. EL199 TaxID=2107581 RepID=UPI000EA29028|nr:copper resistance CopC family protein [Kiloniella sp. EL199]
MKPIFSTLLTVLFLIASLPSETIAHTNVTSTVPANEAILKKSPEEIRLIFPGTLKITALKLLDNQGNELPLKHEKNLTPVKEKIAIPPILDAGNYSVIWRGISADGHPIKGQINFSVSP